jgi:hypothetical protein
LAYIPSSWRLPLAQVQDRATQAHALRSIVQRGRLVVGKNANKSVDITAGA